MSDTRDSIENAITQAFREHGDMVTKWALCAEVIDDEGRRSMWALSPKGQMAWDSLGLLEYARQLEQAETVANQQEDE